MKPALSCFSTILFSCFYFICTGVAVKTVFRGPVSPSRVSSVTACHFAPEVLHYQVES